MFKILITDDLSSQGLALLDEAENITYDVIKGLSEAQLAETIIPYHGLIIRSSVKVTPKVLANAENLRVIGRAGVGIDNIDINQASEQGIIVMNTPGANSMATAEHTIAMLLAVCRNIPQAHSALVANKWDRKKFIGTQLFKKTIGIVGIGRIGSRVALRCRAFGMNVLAYDPYIGADVARDLQITLVDIDELFARSDFISLHAALSSETKHMINAESIATMKDGVYIVNCARGALINEDDLATALKNGKIAGAALDVFNTEPLPATNPLRDLDNIIFTPHIAASTIEAQRDVGTQIVTQVLGALLENNLRNAVNMPLSDPKIFQTMRPFLELAEQVGSLHTQLTNNRINSIEVKFEGELQSQVKLLTVAILKGLLQPILEQNVNYVNTPYLANRRGITVSQTTSNSTFDYPNLITCKATWNGGHRLISATIFHSDQPRIIQIDNYRLDVRPGGRSLVVKSLDVPGIIGKMGSILGKAKINIASMRFGRTSPGGQALTFIKVDNEVSDKTIAKLLKAESILEVDQVVL